ncbi:hypothetical protein CENSYa_0122 [Cenarchaeum symbiosum A]|uniref:Uncharacterized protein n=1 Tax=Cenarchaeum symbiosum (strain A) TaxID=414004 RepID=A0RTV0_CENSY|nr:hypothetical protein CENSYa_0122 [Cenarchaeum symbiosum A]
MLVRIECRSVLAYHVAMLWSTSIRDLTHNLPLQHRICYISVIGSYSILGLWKRFQECECCTQNDSYRLIRSFFCKNSSDNELPRLFKRGSRIFCLGFFVISLIILSLYPIDGNIANDDVANILMINAEILVTTLAVTLGATLLGIQFRAQSYTMIGMIHQMKNYVLYTFIFIFISLIVLSTMTVVYITYLPGDSMKSTEGEHADPEHKIVVVLPFIFLGTSFSMLYLAGYVYYIINKLQPDQMMAEVVKDMNNALFIENDNFAIDLFKIVNEDLDRENLSKKYHDIKTKFAVWEQIMLRAVELNNILIFKMGLEKMFDIYNRVKDVGDVSINDISKNFKRNEYIGELLFERNMQFKKLFEIYHFITKNADSFEVTKLLKYEKINEFLCDRIEELQSDKKIQLSKLIETYDNVIKSNDIGTEKLTNDDDTKLSIKGYYDILERKEQYSPMVDSLLKNKKSKNILYQQIRKLSINEKIEIIQKLYERFLYKATIQSIQEFNKDLFFEHISEVILGCVQHDRQQCSSEFFQLYINDEEPIPTPQEFLEKTYRNTMIRLWHMMMKNSILDGKTHITRLGMNAFNIKLSIDSQSKNTQWATWYYDNTIASLVEWATDPNIKTGNECLLAYLKYFGRHILPRWDLLEKIKSESGDDTDEKESEKIDEIIVPGKPGVSSVYQLVGSPAVKMWRSIMSHAYVKKNMLIFLAGLNEMLNKLQKENDMEHRMSINALSELMMEILKLDLAIDGKESRSITSSELFYSRQYIEYFLQIFADLSWKWPVKDLQITLLWIKCLKIIIKNRELNSIFYTRSELNKYLKQYQTIKESINFKEHKDRLNGVKDELEIVMDGLRDYKIEEEINNELSESMDSVEKSSHI